ncbi:MAG: M20/M25/M40 family metallo-hydrolase [Planctomycetes bacterium]|nr:M20/M25/M40 family metallo-hydrolase [Planctomycetota bacterium]
MATSFLALLLLAWPASAATRPEVAAGDIQGRVAHLASDAMEGRGTGSPGERLAGDYIAGEFERLGLEPAGDDGGWFQGFEVVSARRLGEGAGLRLTLGEWYRDFEPGRDFNPFGFSAGGEWKDLPLVFAGYGVSDAERGYDDYAGLEVAGKAVLVLRHQPREREGLGAPALFTTKALNAKAHGAAALLVVTDPLNHPDDPDAALPFDPHAEEGDLGIPAVHLRLSLVEALFRLAGRDLEATQRAIDTAGAPASFALDGTVSLAASIERSTVTARNVVARLGGADPERRGEAVVVGAHYDHLGRGGSGSLAPEALGEIHNGADDNASGTSGMLEVAEAMASSERPRRTVYFVAFSGEERGLLGSAHFVAHPPQPVESLAAMVNMDMIGRLREDRVEVSGVDTSPGFRALVEGAAAGEGLAPALSGSGLGPSDHQSFYVAGIPVLFFFTGTHRDYHRPSDDADRIEAEGAARVARAALRCVRDLADLESRPEYVRVAAPHREDPHAGAGVPAGGRARLGVMPDYTQESGGMRLSDVSPGGPAEAGGLKGGDVVVALGGQAVDTVYDFMHALGRFKPGDETEVVVLRGGERLGLKVKLGGTP